MRKVISLLFLTLFFLWLSPLLAQTKRIPVAFSAVSAAQAALYVTKEAGLFEKHGLTADLVYVSSGTKVAQAVIAREFPVALAGGTIVNANLAGGDIVVVGGVVNVPSFYFLVQPSIKRVEDLRGKAVGITRFTSSTDYTVRYFLKKNALEPDRDVKILQMGGQPEILAGVQAGVIQGGIFSSPADYKARKVGFVQFADMSKIGLDYPTVSIVSTRSYVKSDPATVKNFLMAYSEGMSRLFKDKEFTMKVIGKYTRTEDRDVLEAAYSFSTNFMHKARNILHSLGRSSNRGDI
jgi:ABC-type nitrate/sulfonate/bicarbonate transport system substrate-binding protein